MSQVFISHVEPDAALAEAIADGLEAAGYEPWYYERNSLPGAPYITQVLTAIGESDALVIVLSKDAFASLQVDKEIIRAYEGAKPFVPLLVGVTHVEFRAHKPDWSMMLGASTSVAVPPEGVAAIIPRMVAGLKVMGVHPGSEHSLATATASAATLQSPAAPLAAESPSRPPAPGASPPIKEQDARLAPPAETRARRWLPLAAGAALALIGVIGFGAIRSGFNTPAESTLPATAPVIVAAPSETPTATATATEEPTAQPVVEQETEPPTPVPTRPPALIPTRPPATAVPTAAPLPPAPARPVIGATAPPGVTVGLMGS